MTARAAVRRPADELDDLTLRRAQAGDPAALRTLVERYQRPIWDLCWRMAAPIGLGDRAEDLTQDTLVRVCRALPTFDPRGPARLSTWILTIAARLALNELRRQRPEPLGDEVIAASAATPRQHHEAREAGERIAAAVGRLTAEARAVLILRDVYELDYEAIATALSLELGTVKSRLARARAAVRATLAAEGMTP
ncbi:MAG: sigma-70 family RNA polymerase sigma factor [Kofleriaceae bacterium]|nr:sigma-70 family RNA polymerase sigma factor [Kofleriaceae bacterium]MBP9170299.1 sigma-70 family RNA polymerase sigma factor [Kofleriaceae bacterium]MBP9860046.1 sigma-70 family RNA polymerase sigma factor [Kofleriaceae bacterium]